MVFAYSCLFTPINLKILLSATLLLITSNLAYGMSEMLIGLDRIRTVGLIGVLEILLQFVVFYLVYYFAGTSLIILRWSDDDKIQLIKSGISCLFSKS